MSAKVGKRTPKNKIAARIRRRKVRELWAACFTEEEMAEKLGVTEKTIERDKAAIRAEMKDVLEPTDDSVGTIVVGYDKVIQGFIKQYHETSDERTRTAALRGVADTIEKKARLMQSMGIIPKVADELTLGGSLTIDTEAFAKAFAKYRGEKDEKEN